MKPSRSFIAVGALLAWGAAQAASAQEAAAAHTAAPQPKAPLGRWITESGNLEVDIAPCPGSTAPALCGRVVRVLANRSMSAPGADMAAADARPALGMTLLSGLRPAGGGSSEYQGEIYNRENAKTYRVNLTPAEPEQLLVHAYVGIPLFGKTQVWRRPAAEHGGGQ
ncbi:MAG: DUF2147 domain-containing protein [Acidovorax sp.]|uniref:DUF2147 domain-containing protein n=1 Tax=Acidovorax sp. TaxID=1872122 RepID=UPI0025C6EA38|nr:DUF2147 domain-containing protein [Acidovorax sp.]MCE1193423.1 DUF2147 domain-containing protein [Acidovorax sp.]